MNDAILLPVSRFCATPPAVTKIKRGAISKEGNNGSAHRRVHTPPRAIRDMKNGKHLPWPQRGPVIWDPADPVIIEYQRAQMYGESLVGRWGNFRGVSPERKRVFVRHEVTAPRADPIYARKRELRTKGLSRREVRWAMAHERA
jgi:hypothetical protein